MRKIYCRCRNSLYSRQHALTTSAINIYHSSRSNICNQILINRIIYYSLPYLHIINRCIICVKKHTLDVLYCNRTLYRVIYMKEYLPIREGYLTNARVSIKLPHTTIIQSHCKLLCTHIQGPCKQQCK